jgi:hypothetical protein
MENVHLACESLELRVWRYPCSDIPDIVCVDFEPFAIVWGVKRDHSVLQSFRGLWVRIYLSQFSLSLSLHFSLTIFFCSYPLSSRNPLVYRNPSLICSQIVSALRQPSLYLPVSGLWASWIGREMAEVESSAWERTSCFVQLTWYVELGNKEINTKLLLMENSWEIFGKLINLEEMCCQNGRCLGLT